MSKETVIKVTNATVRFNKATENYNGLKEYVIKMLKGELMFQEFLALKDVNLEVKKGESWGLIGTNGSGKSTLLKLICGILKPYKGAVEVHGKIAPLIELGAGFDPQLTARENIYLNGALLGHKKPLWIGILTKLLNLLNWGILLMFQLRTFLLVCRLD